MRVKERIGSIVAWFIVSTVAGVLMLRDLWLYGELRGGHVWRSWGEGEKLCMMCGARNDKINCRDYALKRLGGADVSDV